MLHDYKLPSLGDGVSGNVTEILVKPGDAVSAEQIVIVVGTEKVDAEMPVDVDGVVEEVLVKKGDEVTEGTLVLRIRVGEGATAPVKAIDPEPAAPAPVQAEKTAPAPIAPAQPQVKPVPSATMRTSPLARKRARELGVDLSEIVPSEGSDRISYKDVLAYVKRRLDAGGGSVSARKPLPDFSKFGEVERKAQSNVGIKTAEAMSYSTNTIPHAWIGEKADITRIETLRQQYKEQVKAAGGGLTMTAILTKAVSVVLRRMPQFNASFDEQANEVVYKKYINIGIAVDTPAGLFVPNIKNVDQKSLTQISIDLADISTRAKSGKITLPDLQGGTFTISNIGGTGGTNMHSIVNWPEVAILSVVAAQMEPVWSDVSRSFEPRLMMPMTIGWDHRVINGGDAARFLVELKKILEELFVAWL